MDHKHVSGYESLSEILYQMKYTRKLNWVAKQITGIVWSQMGWCNKPTKLQLLIKFKTWEIWCSQTLWYYESTKVDRRTKCLHVLSWTLWSTSSDTHQVVVQLNKLIGRTIEYNFECFTVNLMHKYCMTIMSVLTWPWCCKSFMKWVPKMLISNIGCELLVECQMNRFICEVSHQYHSFQFLIELFMKFHMNRVIYEMSHEQSNLWSVSWTEEFLKC